MLLKSVMRGTTDPKMPQMISAEISWVRCMYHGRKNGPGQYLHPGGAKLLPERYSEEETGGPRRGPSARSISTGFWPGLKSRDAGRLHAFLVLLNPKGRCQGN